MLARRRVITGTQADQGPFIEPLYKGTLCAPVRCSWVAPLPRMCCRIQEVVASVNRGRQGKVNLSAFWVMLQDVKHRWRSPRQGSANLLRSPEVISVACQNAGNSLSCQNRQLYFRILPLRMGSHFITSHGRKRIFLVEIFLTTSFIRIQFLFQAGDTCIYYEKYHFEPQS